MNTSSVGLVCELICHCIRDRVKINRQILNLYFIITEVGCSSALTAAVCTVAMHARQKERLEQLIQSSSSNDRTAK